MAESGAKQESPLVQRLMQLEIAQSDLRKLIQTTKNEAARREKEVKSLTSLIERQQQTVKNLNSPRTKVAMLLEYKALRLSLVLNYQNIALAQQMLKEAKRQLASHEQKLQACQQAITSIKKELDDRGKVLLFPARRAS